MSKSGARTAVVLTTLLVASCSRGPNAVVDVRPQQDTAGEISGVVTDARGRHIGGVAVMASSSRGRSMALTDDHGRFRIRHLAAGEYEVTFDPCQPDTVTETVVVDAGTGRRVDAVLGAPSARLTNVPTPQIAGGSSDARSSPPVAGVGKSAEDRRRLLTDAAADADEIWIIARSGSGARANLRRRYAAGLMCAYVPTSGKDVPLPMAATDVRAHVSGHVAAVDVEQHYSNPFDEKIEAVYVFPLPESAAVGEFIMTIGSRRIRGIVRDRDEAQRIYDEARAGGFVAALLTQQRPNVFTQRIANIEPGASVDVKLTYYHLLPYRDGAYTFVFPTVVGPRYSAARNRDGIGAVYTGDEGRARHATVVPYLRPGRATKRTFSMSVELDAGVTVESIESPNYAVRTRRVSTTRHRVELARGSAQPNKDYVLRYKVAGDAMKSGFMVAEGEGDRYFSFILQPPEDLATRVREPVDLVLVVDRSVSMRGEPSRTLRRAVRRLIGNLGSDDRFRVVTLGAQDASAGAPTAPGARALGRALVAIEDVGESRTTDLSRGLRAAIDAPASRGRARVVALLSDGYVSDEADLVRMVRRQGDGVRMLAIGVGTAVNRHLMERVARAGNGAAVYLDTGDDAGADRAMTALLARLSHPVLSNIELDFGAMDIREVYPARVPDLLVGQPVIVTGKLRGRVGDRVRVKGKVRGKPIAYDLQVRATSVTPRKELANLWARMKIEDLRERMPGIAAEIARLARTHGLLSPATSVLGIDARKSTGKSQGRVVHVPAPLPEGVAGIE